MCGPWLIMSLSLLLLCNSCWANGDNDVCTVSNATMQCQIISSDEIGDCARVDYTFSWFTVGQNRLISTPANPIDSSCPSFVFQDTVEGKQVSPLSKANEKGSLRMVMAASENWLLGIFKLEKIVKAFENAESSSRRGYLDYSTFVKSMCSELDVGVGQEIMAYSARRLRQRNQRQFRGTS